MNVRLTPMTKELCKKYFQEFEMDPVMFVDPAQFQPYCYSAEKCAATVDRYRLEGRIYLAIMLGNTPIGELIFKKVDPQKKCCTMGVHLKNDQYKNKGYGTQAELLALQYAFTEHEMETVYADALKHNTRSRHVLEKVGFQKIKRDTHFVYYECTRANWNPAIAAII